MGSAESIESWTRANIPSQAGRRVLITGGKGLARHVALALCRTGAEVILAGRNRAEGEASVAKIKSSVPSAKLHLEDLDLTSLESVKGFASRMHRTYPSLDVLVANAGVIAVPQREVTRHGFELHLGTNFLGHFALAAQLMPLLRRGTRPRVISVGAIAANNVAIDFDDLQCKSSYHPMKAYGRSKLANLIFALELHRRSVANTWGVASIAVHPGLALDRADLKENISDKSIGAMTRLLAPLIFQSAAMGILPYLYGIASEEAESGQYYGPDSLFETRGYPRVAKIPAPAKDLDTASRLWSVANDLTNIDFDSIASGDGKIPAK